MMAERAGQYQMTAPSLLTDYRAAGIEARGVSAAAPYLAFTPDMMCVQPRRIAAQPLLVRIG